jgi:hypothetical protein
MKLRGPGGAPPLVAVIHLPPSLSLGGFPGREAALQAVRTDVEAAERAGVDGVLLENDADKPHTMVVSKAQVAWLALEAEAARRVTRLPLGIGVQRIDWEASLAVAAAAALDFVRLDVFVDRVRMQGELVVVDPDRVLALRASLGIERVELWTDVHVKHAELVEGSPIGASAREAARRGADAVLVSGTRTGEPPAVADLRRAREGASPVPVLVGSGLTPELAATMAAHADGAVVGTWLKADGRVSVERGTAMVEAWRSACASRR